MYSNDRGTFVFDSFVRTLMIFGTTLAVAGALVLTGCDSSGVAEEPQDVEVVISPTDTTIGVGEEVDFSVVALTASGDTIQGASVMWASTDPSVFTVQDNGLATGQASGSAYCTVEVSGETANASAEHLAPKRRFVGLDSAFVSVF